LKVVGSQSLVTDRTREADTITMTGNQMPAALNQAGRLSFSLVLFMRTKLSEARIV